LRVGCCSSSFLDGVGGVYVVFYRQHVTLRKTHVESSVLVTIVNNP
jgi:hypothetical protein